MSTETQFSNKLIEKIILPIKLTLRISLIILITPIIQRSFKNFTSDVRYFHSSNPNMYFYL